jgi:mono/diheme cytochrome c family protein
MDREFWLRLHGASTHFPIVLLAVSVGFDSLGNFWPNESKRSGLRSAGFLCALLGMVGAIGAVISGILISRGRMMGTGLLLRHHQFVWPGVAISFALVAWRVAVGDRASFRAFCFYLAGMMLASGLVLLAAYFGGELVLASAPLAGDENASSSQKFDPVLAANGRHLFLMNCAHCHADDGSGDEGPDLHGLRKTDARVAGLIRNGIKGEMPRFGEKLKDKDVQALIAYLHSLSKNS